MPITIKNEETCRLAHQLAKMTGSTAAAAIKLALESLVERERRLKHCPETARSYREGSLKLYREMFGSSDSDCGKRK